MNPWKVSAQFAAFVWFINARTTATRAEALRFARENWVGFLPAAHEGVGKLLIRVARLPSRRDRNYERRSASPARKRSIKEMSGAAL